MTLYESILYGIVQGLCEFLPISSSGHLSLLHSFFGSEISGGTLCFDLFLHLGTLFAVVTLYRKDILLLIKAFFSLTAKLFQGNFHLSLYTHEERWVVFTIIAALPLIPAALLSDEVSFIMNYPVAVGSLLILNALLLSVSERLGRNIKGLEEMTSKNALVIGLCQLVAILPGISRSGMTITAGLSQGLNRESAVRFSFITSIPTILGASVVTLPSLLKNEHLLTENAPLYLAGAASAAITGILSIGLLRLISKRSSFKVFSVYCAVIGAGAIIFQILN